MDCNDAPEFIPDQDDWTQRLKENPTDPLEEIRQEFEGFLTQLEALAVQAIATNDWDAFYQHLIEFQSGIESAGVNWNVWNQDPELCQYIEACETLAEDDIEGLIEALTAQIRGKVYVSRTEEWEVISPSY